MRITTKLVLDIESGAVLERKSGTYCGPVALCRGGEKTKQRLVQSQLQQQNALNQQLLGQQQQLQGQLLPQFQAIAASPGYTPEEKAARVTAAMGPLGARFDAAREAAANRVARTRNEAGYGELEDELAREQGRQAGELGAELESTAADKAHQERLQALGDIAGLYGVDTNLLSRAMGLPAQLIGEYPVSRGGFLSSLGAGFGGGLGRALVPSFSAGGLSFG